MDYWEINYSYGCIISLLFSVTGLVFLLGALSATSYYIIRTEGKLITVKKESVRFGLKQSQLAVTIIVILYTVGIRARFVSFFNGFLEVCARLERLGVHINYGSLAKIILLKQGTVLTVPTALNCISCITDTNYNYISCGTYFITYNVTFAVASVVITTLYSMVMISSMQIMTLNNTVVNIVHKGNFDKENKLQKIFYNRKNPTETLRSVTTFHFDIVKNTNTINETCAVQILLMLFKSVMSSLEGLQSVLSGEMDMVVAYDLFWSALTLMEFLIMFLLIGKVTDGTRRTPQLVNMIVTKDDPRLNFEKNMFLLQSKHQKVHITACGCFDLTTRTFLVICGKVATYLAIIIDYPKWSN